MLGDAEYPGLHVQGRDQPPWSSDTRSYQGKYSTILDGGVLYVGVLPYINSRIICDLRLAAGVRHLGRLEKCFGLTLIEPFVGLLETLRDVIVRKDTNGPDWSWLLGHFKANIK